MMPDTPKQIPSCYVFPATGAQVGRQAVLLAIDEVSFPLRDRLSAYLSKPDVRPEPVLTPDRDDPDAPDNAATHFYGGGGAWGRILKV